MMHLLKKSAFMGIGLAALSTSAVKRLGNKIAEESKMSEKEGQKLVQDLLEESTKSKAQLQKKIEKTVKDSMAGMDLATSEDISAVNKRLDEIDKNMDKLTATLDKETKATKVKK